MTEGGLLIEVLHKSVGMAQIESVDRDIGEVEGDESKSFGRGATEVESPEEGLVVHMLPGVIEKMLGVDAMSQKEGGNERYSMMMMTM